MSLWAKKNDEDSEAYIYRICGLKDSSGLTWKQIAEIINNSLGINYGESAYRKRWAAFQNGMKACEKQIFTDDEYLNEIKKQTEELYKAKKQFQDQRREYSKMLAVEARSDHLTSEMIKAANRLASEKMLYSDGCINYNATNEAVLVLTDWHYGLVTENIWNEYNTKVCIARLKELLTKTKYYCKLHSVDKLHVVSLGDLIHGSIHTSVRVASEEDTCDQLMHVAELLAEFLSEVSEAVNEVVFYSTYGNHARTIQNKKDSVHSDNMEKIVGWWIKQRLINHSKIEVINCDLYEFVYLNVLGHDIVAVHGDLERFDKLGVDMYTLFSKQYGLNVEYVFSGDKHHFESNDIFGIENVMVSSLCGVDEYANSKRLYSKPGQTLCVFNETDGKICTYNINFA